MMAASERHKSYTIEDLSRTLVPPLVLGQFYIRDGVFITWAFLSDEAETAFVGGTSKLQPRDWNSGSICWAMDVLVEDDGAKNLLTAFRHIRLRYPNIKTFKYRRWHPDKPRRYVTMEFGNET